IGVHSTSHSWRGASFVGFVVYSVTHCVRSWSRHCLRGGGRRRTPSTWSRARRLSFWRMWRFLQGFRILNFLFL
ncbi:hypothetical protein LINPERHAP2_LOCUS15170, partial [Linum perenne]